MRKTLKNYDQYWGRITAYAKASGIAIELKPEDSDGCYIPSRSKIRVDNTLSEAHTIAVLLHELGHAFDIGIANKKLDAKTEKAYEAVLRGKYTPAQKDLFMACEERAWDGGVVIAKNLKIRLGKWFTDSRNKCIKSHRGQ